MPKGYQIEKVEKNCFLSFILDFEGVCECAQCLDRDVTGWTPPSFSQVGRCLFYSMFNVSFILLSDNDFSVYVYDAIEIIRTLDKPSAFERRKLR